MDRATVSLRLDPDQRSALRLEALRRAESGESRKIDISQVIRDLIDRAPWRRKAVNGVTGRDAAR